MLLSLYSQKALGKTHGQDIFEDKPGDSGVSDPVTDTFDQAIFSRISRITVVNRSSVRGNPRKLIENLTPKSISMMVPTRMRACFSGRSFVSSFLPDLRTEGVDNQKERKNCQDDPHPEGHETRPGCELRHIGKSCGFEVAPEAESQPDHPVDAIRFSHNLSSCSGGHPV